MKNEISKKEKMPKTLKILSWNVNFPTFGKSNDYVIKVIESISKPDVICLQEYVGGRDAELLKWFDAHGYKTEYLPFSHRGSMSQGVMTAIRKNLKAETHHVVLREDGPGKIFRRFPNIRGLLNTRIVVDGTEVSIANFHSTYPRPHVIEKRRREFQELIMFLDSNKDNPLLLCGDFNFIGNDIRRKILKSRYKHFTGGGYDKTWRHFGRYSPIRTNLDYYFWKGLNVDAQLLPFSDSDHRPMLATISLENY